jgi:hypothetical protein
MKANRSQLLRRAILGAALFALALPTASFAALKYEPSDYVQDGLVVHLDGIRNAGADKPHDPGAATYLYEIVRQRPREP